MTDESPAILDRLLRTHGLNWMIELFAPPDSAVPYLLEQLDKVAVEYQRRIGGDVPFTPEMLAAEASRNPHKVRAFFQALSTSRNAEMLVMVWRILQGLSIREVVMNYREQESYSLTVTLARLESPLETYCSKDINDAALLRHFGITTVDGRPLFDGFFPDRAK